MAHPRRWNLSNYRMTELKNEIKQCGHSMILELEGTTDDHYPNLTSQGVQIVTHQVTYPTQQGSTSVEQIPHSLAGICQIFALTKG